MALSSSACAACKFLDLNCTQECVFAPYFPDQPHMRSVFELFGASYVAKMLNRVSPEQRKDVANSLAYEAHMRLIDPLYGCYGEILELKQGISQKRHLLEVRRRMLTAKVGPAAADAAFAAAAADAAAFAAAVAAAAAGGDAAAAVLLGHNVPNVFVPPPPFYHHPQQPVQMEDGVQMGDAVQWGVASGGDGGDGVQMGVGAVCGSDADEATAAACSGRKGSEITEQKEKVRNSRLKKAELIS